MSERPKVAAGPLLAGATVAMGLLAGLFYAYACSVMPGLAGSSDRSFVDVMRHINVAIENPVFFATFFGAPLLVAWYLVVEWRSGPRDVLRWASAALALYTLGFLVTIAFNIPLNDELMKGGIRSDFEDAWVAWNIVRTVLVTGAFCCLACALWFRSDPARPR